jgi:hypothetical protein
VAGRARGNITRTWWLAAAGYSCGTSATCARSLLSRRARAATAAAAHVQRVRQLSDEAVMLPAQLVTFVRERMAAEATESGSAFVAEAGGMTLGGTIGRSAHLRPDGSIWIYEVVNWVESPEDFRWRMAERQEAFGWLQLAARRCPELTELMPHRGTDDTACPGCGGSGQLTRGGRAFEGVWCEQCSGLGWIVP